MIMADLGGNGSALDALPGTNTAGLPQDGKDVSSAKFNSMFSVVPQIMVGPDGEPVDPADMPSDLNPQPQATYVDPFGDYTPPSPSANEPAAVDQGIPPSAPATGSSIDPVQMAIEHERLKMYAEKLAPMAPLMQFLQEKRPDILETIQQAIQQESTPRIPEPKAPEAPVRPASYNPAEAFANPESDSWKYREAMEQFNQNKIDFLQKQIEFRDRLQQAQLQKQQQLDKQQLLVRQSYSDAIANGLSEVEAADYVKVMSHPATLDPKNLVKYYRLLRQNAPRQKQPNTPPVPGGGFTVGQGSQDQFQSGFNSMLKGWKKSQQ
jgi:hypothetical protein